MPDDAAPTPDPAPDAPPRRHRRRRPWRIALVALVVVLVVVAGVAVVGYVSLDKSIKTFSGTGISSRRPPPTVHGQNVLLIGSDTRAGADRSLGGKGDAVGRSDTALLVHVYEGGRRAVAVSIPRDALVDIPACRLPDGSWSQPRPDEMFNAAYSVGGTAQGNPACTVNTVEKLTGLRVDHTVIADFAAFSAMTKIVGGVPVCVPHPVYQGDLDPNRTTRGGVVFTRGVQEVSGRKALDYVRIRHGLGDGSDIGRMRRQQAFLGSVIAKVRAKGLTPTHLLPLARAATRYLTVDPGLGSAGKLLSFVLGLRHMAPSDIVFLTAPWRYDGPRVALVHPDVDRLWQALQEDEPVTAAGQGSGVEGRTVAQRLSTVTSRVRVVGPGAARTARALRSAGVSVGAVAAGAGGPATVVRFGPGQGAQASALAALVRGATLRSAEAPGLRLELGGRHRLRPLTATAPPPTPLPRSVTDDARSAASGPCSDITYGSASGQ